MTALFQTTVYYSFGLLRCSSPPRIFVSFFLNDDQLASGEGITLLRSTGLTPFVSQPVDIVRARTRDLAKQLGPNFEEIDNDTPGSQNE